VFALDFKHYAYLTSFPHAHYAGDPQLTLEI